MLIGPSQISCVLVVVASPGKSSLHLGRKDIWPRHLPAAGARNRFLSWARCESILSLSKAFHLPVIFHSHSIPSLLPLQNGCVLRRQLQPRNQEMIPEATKVPDPDVKLA